MRRPSFLPPARVEFLESLRYYSVRSPKLAHEFLNAVREAIASSLEFPEAAPLLREGIRRKVVRRFPFSLLYTLDAANLIIIAVMHHRRHPEYWLNRVDGA